MSLKRTMRRLRRGMIAGIVWAMMPLVIVSGSPLVSCACVACGCGAACPLDHSAAACQSSQSSSVATAHSSQNCCCCNAADLAGRSKADQPTQGIGFSGHQSRCHAVIALRSATQPTATAQSNEQMPALDCLVDRPLRESLPAIQRLDELNTGPPIDLILTLGHLVI